MFNKKEKQILLKTRQPSDSSSEGQFILIPDRDNLSYSCGCQSQNFEEISIYDINDTFYADEYFDHYLKSPTVDCTKILEYWIITN